MIGKLLTTTALVLLLAGAAQAQTQTAPATTTETPGAPAAAAPATPPGVDVASLKPTNMSALKVDDIKGVDVLDPAGQKIASINDIVLTQDGKVDAVIVDFGGFLGIGTKQIALGYEGLQFMDDANGKHFLVVNATKDQLNTQQAYNKDDYANNRDAERLVVSGAAGAASTAAAAAGSSAASAEPAANAAPPATTSADNATPAPAATAPAATNDTAAAPASGAMAKATDPADFANKAGTANMFEIVSSQQAVAKAQNADVKSFAQKMIDDHTKAGEEMKTAASSENVTPPASLDPDNQAKVAALDKLSGADFDKQYVADQVKAHEDAVALFKDYSSNGKAGALKDFAGKTLPTLQMHYDMVQKLPK